MNFNFDTMNNTNEQPDLNSGENKENENTVDEMEEIKRYNELSEEDKKIEIENRRTRIDGMAKEFELDLEEDIEDVKEDLDKKYVEYAGMQKDLDAIDEADLDSDAKEGLEEMRNVLSSLNGIYKKQLHIEYLQYVKEYKEYLENPEALLGSHGKRNLLMDNWETLIGGIQADLNKTGQEEEDTMRAWARWVKEHPKASLAILMALIATGVTVAILMAPEGGGALTVPTIKMGTGIVTKMFSGTGAVAGAGAGVMVGGGVLAQAIKYISDEENRDKIVEGLAGGVKIPAFAYWANGRPSAKKAA